MSTPPDYVAGILITPQVAVLLEANGLHEFRVRTKGANPDVDRVLHGIRHLAMASAAATSVDGSGPRKATEGAPESKQWVTPAEAAELLGVTDAGIRLAAREGRLPGAQMQNGRWAIPLDQINLRRTARRLGR